jgi:RHS repeat-associated protein
VEQIAYNAKGQRTLVVYGNGVMTRHAYDAQTFRLVRLRTERFSQPSDLVYQPKGVPLQDFAYRYDLVGNILEIQDRTPESGIPNTVLGMDALDRAFTYDPIYRLLSATGREADRPPELPDWLDQPRGTDATRTRGYTERYQYDVAGNMLQLQHQTQNDSFNRDFSLEAINNRLKTVSKGETDFTYTYDVNGNLIQENKSRYFEWNHSDQLRSFRTQAGTSEPSVYAHYLYDAAGERVKKLVRKQGGEIEVTVYIDGLFEYHRRVQGSSTHENNSLHVMDDQSRIALVRVGKAFPDDQTPAVKFHLGDHLGSSNVVVDDAGELINREEYTPCGETSFGSFAKKRYRFTGKERDEESGLNYHGARYYLPYLARWTSCDPAGIVDGTNLYAYVRNNPIRLVDPTGMEGEGEENASSVKPRNYSQAPSKMSQISGTQGEKGLPIPMIALPPKADMFDIGTSQFREQIFRSRKSTTVDKTPKPPEKKSESTSTSRNLFASLSSALTILGGPSDDQTIKILQRVSGSLEDISDLKGSSAGLNVLAAGATAIAQVSTSPAKTWLAQGADGFLAGGASFLLGRSNPIVAAGDATIGLLSGGKLSLSNTVSAGAHLTVTGVESLLTWDASSLREFGTRNRNGDYGWLAEGAGSVSDFILPASLTGDYGDVTPVGKSFDEWTPEQRRRSTDSFKSKTCNFGHHK